MIGFKQFIAEAFDSAYDFSKMNDRRYTFTDDEGKSYVVEYEISEGTLDVGFGVKTKNNRTHFNLQNNGKNAIKVYSTIRQIIYKIINSDKDIDTITFMSADDRTIRVYSRFAIDMAKKYRGSISNSEPRGYFKIYIREH